MSEYKPFEDSKTANLITLEQSGQSRRRAPHTRQRKSIAFPGVSMKKNKPVTTVEYFLTISEAARILRCSASTIRNRVAAGLLTPRFSDGKKLLFSREQVLGR